MIPKVDTFEHDIVDEIKRKDATLTSVAAASSDAGSIPLAQEEIVLPKKKPVFLIVLFVFFIIFICGLIGVAYIYFTDPLLPPSAKEMPIKKEEAPKINTDLASISPTLHSQIGKFVTLTEKKERGYILSISDYASVFSYMSRRENEYIEELAKQLPQIQPATTTPATILTASTTPTSSTTQQVATTTKTAKAQPSVKKPTIKVATTTPEEPKEIIAVDQFKKEDILTSTFTNITLSNQNMRVWKSGTRSVVYAFVGNNKVIISNSPEGVLALKGAILH